MHAKTYPLVLSAQLLGVLLQASSCLPSFFALMLLHPIHSVVVITYKLDMKPDDGPLVLLPHLVLAVAFWAALMASFSPL